MRFELATKDCDADYRRVIITIDKDDISKVNNQHLLSEGGCVLPRLYLFNSLFLEKKRPLQVYDLLLAKNTFKFLPNHPTLNCAYAMTPLFPDLYIPIEEFHDYLWQDKYSTFIKFCANLGAKEINLEYLEIDNEKASIKKTLPEDMKHLIQTSSNIYSMSQLHKFGKRNNKMTEYYSPWISTEPSWRELKELRLNNDLSMSSVEFNYLDDMCINREIYHELDKLDIHIKNKTFRKMKLKYSISFWDTGDSHEND
jgi:hypothetical protein